jgi:uncharacterized SAM-binding protein YcdF (DUF218 family)
MIHQTMTRTSIRALTNQDPSAEDVKSASRAKGTRFRVMRWVLTGFRGGVAATLIVLTLWWAVIEHTTLPDLLVSPLLLADSNGHGDAIVVLGAGIIGRCEPNLSALRRVLKATQVWREGRAPIMIFTGGAPTRKTCAISQVMAALAADLGVPESAIRAEGISHSTHENALYAAPILRSLNSRRIILVSDRLHMIRGVGSFQHFGFAVEPVSVPVYATNSSSTAMLMGGARETVALAWYWWKGWLDPQKP